MRVFAAALLSICVAVSASWGDEPYSGPQVGERLVPFTVQGTFGEVAGKAFDVVTMADGKPVLIIFVHEVTRPSLGLTRLVMSYAASRAKDGLVSGVVFLSADPTETENWMKRISRAAATRGSWNLARWSRGAGCLRAKSKCFAHGTRRQSKQSDG